MLNKGKIIQLGTVVFWLLFWFFSVLDKFITQKFLWVGKDFFDEFVELFESIGISNIVVVGAFYWFVVALEIVAFLFMFFAFLSYFKNQKKSENFFFWGIFFSLFIFSFFMVGDQIFGEREELLEHTIYWVAVIVSWGAYKYFPKLD